MEYRKKATWHQVTQNISISEGGMLKWRNRIIGSAKRVTDSGEKEALTAVREITRLWSTIEKSEPYESYCKSDADRALAMFNAKMAEYKEKHPSLSKEEREMLAYGACSRSGKLFR